MPVDEARVVVQGYGKVGAPAVQLLHDQGCLIVGVGDAEGAVFNPRGLSPVGLSAHNAEAGTVAGFDGGEPITNEELLALESDVVIPAALEGVITEANADDVHARIVVEAANGPTTPYADAVLAELPPLIEEGHLAHFVPLNGDGSAQVSGVWVGIDGDELVTAHLGAWQKVKNVRNDPRLSLTILGDSWYDHVTLLGRAVTFRQEGGFDDLDSLSRRYTGEPYARTHLDCTTVLAQVERWHAWGNPKQLAELRE
jgi:hypothetical protein